MIPPIPFFAVLFFVILSESEAKANNGFNNISISPVPRIHHDQVIDKTKDLNVRSHLLINNLSQYAQDKRNGLTEDPNYSQTRVLYKTRKDNRDRGHSKDRN